MARKRESNKHLPERVYFKHGAYYYVQRVDNKNKWIKLGLNLPEAMQVWASLVDVSNDLVTMAHLFDRYMREVSPQKAPASYASNQKEIKPLIATFGCMLPSKVTPQHIYKYIDMRSQKARVGAIREKALLSHVYTKAIEWGIVDNNPCSLVKRSTTSEERKETKKKKRHVTDEELDAVKNFMTHEIGKSIIDLAYITGLRETDLLKIKMSDLWADGLYVHLSKTSEELLFEWTPELIKILEHAKTHRKKINSEYLFCTRTGDRYTPDGFRSIWARARDKALEEGLLKATFKFRDVRRKAGTEAEAMDGRERARKLLGHTDQKTTAIYISGIQKVKPLR